MEGETASSCLGRAAVPVKRVWRGIRARLGLRRRRTTAGLRRLRKEVRTCEYSDVHVMWEMLSSTSAAAAAAAGQGKATTTRARVAGRKASYCSLSLS
ncbi:hypothetical protein BS78_02G008100 [Paspalum vaginatum]|nr:hypothetical protein BS78_02G008100 [Paspalum vaginatum]